MAERIEQNLFLQEINQALKNEKCFKLLLESLMDFTELLFLEQFREYCENLQKKLDKYQLQKTNPEAYVERNISVRDDIVCNLDMLWNIFSTGLKQCVCLTFFKLFKIISKENDCLFGVLTNCLNCHDHFVAFQSYKVLCEVFNYFPNLVIGVQFEKLMIMSLSVGSKNTGPWLPIYTSEILKCLFIYLDVHKNSSETLKLLSCCTSNEEHNDRICAKKIWTALCHYWLKLTDHFLAKLSTVLKAENSVVTEESSTRFNPLQQILVTMLSHGRLFIQSFNLVLANQNMDSHAENVTTQTTKDSSLTVDCKKMDLPIGELSKSTKRARIRGNESLSDSELHHYTCRMCQNAIFKDDCIDQSVYSGKVSSTYDCKMRVFLENIVRELFEIDHKKCVLHFSQTVFQFLNDIVSAISEQYFSVEKTAFYHERASWTTGVCSIMVENGSRLLVNIPQVMGEVYFGGIDNRQQETLDVHGLSYDEVCLRKVLLVVLKLTLVKLHTQNDSSMIIENWLHFVTEVAQLGLQSVAVWLVQLFSEQDDELICLLLTLLQLHQEIFCRKSLQLVPSWVNCVQNSFNPHEFFMEFLTSINHDHSLLLDFLISNETHFLIYFYNYLRHLANDWHGFVEIIIRRQVLSKEEKSQLFNVVQLPDGDGSGFSSSSKQFCETGGHHGNDFVYGDLDDGHETGDSDGVRSDDNGEGLYDDDHEIGDDDGVSSDDIDGSDDNDGCLIGDGGKIVVDDVGINSDYNDGSGDNDCGCNNIGDEIGIEDGGVSSNDNDGRYDGSGLINDGDEIGDDDVDGGSDNNYGSDYNDGSGDNYGGFNNNGDEIGIEDCGVSVNDKDGRYDGSGLIKDGDEINDDVVGISSDYNYGSDDSDGGFDNDIENVGVNSDDSEVTYEDDGSCDDVDNDDSGMVNSKMNDLQRTLTCLIRLRYVVERMSSKGLFPYPVTALVKVMKYIESLYEEEGETVCDGEEETEA